MSIRRMEGTNLFWGEIHTHTNLSDGNGSPEDNFKIAKSHLDFWAMADHAYDEVVFSCDNRKKVPERHSLNEDWGQIQELCRTFENPGIFVPFLAYEWTNFRYGHHNVYYLEYDQPIRMPPTLPALYESLSGVDAFVIPHHGGYPVGICGKDWDFHDERLSPFVEIYSVHGSSELSEGIEPLVTSGSWMGPGGSGGSVQEGLARGYRLGIMASSDSHGEHPGAYDNGLIAAYAKDLSRASLWEAFRNRRIYGVTGDRIILDFSINGCPMGSHLSPVDRRSIHVSAVCWDKIERVDIVKNNRILHCFIDPRGSVMQPGRKRCFRFMVEWGWDMNAERDWDGRLTLCNGNILQAVPCFRGNATDRKDRGIMRLSSSECRWKSRTKPISGKYFKRFADAIAFEVEGDEETRLEFSFDSAGLKRNINRSPSDILGKSTVTYMETVPQTNDGAYWFNMATRSKIKLHQGRLTDQLTLDLTYEDVPAKSQQQGTDFYYIRLIQRNGQRAWSSPIWTALNG